MKLTLSWLKEHLVTDASLKEITERLTMLGLEVEKVVDQGNTLSAFKTAQVVSTSPHPNADRLQLCTVSTGDANFEVVCGAPNAHAGMIGVFAPEGAFIPGLGTTIKRTEIRGVESSGMLLSEKELEISDEHSGIIELPADTEIGVPCAKVMGLDDPVIEIAITPNRGDCLGVRGIARDLAASGVGVLKPFTTEPTPGSFESPINWRRDFPQGSGKANQVVVGRSFRGVANGPSPKWLQDRLRAIGLRPISRLVDISNYISYDLGRPLHIFDSAKLKGDLTMRFAKNGEKVSALDEKVYELDESMTVISDEVGVQSIGGIMGGSSSGCTDATTDIFLEVALFDPINIASTGRKLGIESDARYRFERGVDPTSVMWGTEAASGMILSLCGGEASELTMAGKIPDGPSPISFRVERLQSFGGISISSLEVETILGALGFGVSGKGKILSITPPTWRPDIESENCLIEEVLRIYGYEAVEAVPLARVTALPRPILTRRQRYAAIAKKSLAARGMMEIVTWSFVSSHNASIFGGGHSSLRIDNPISTDLNQMRPSLLPNLLSAAGRNADRGFPDLALFELGPTFHADTADGQRQILGGLRYGKFIGRHWSEKSRPVDPFDVKADVLAVLEVCGVHMPNLSTNTDVPKWYHPGRAGTLNLGPQLLAHFGEIHPIVLRDLDLVGSAVGFEIFLDSIPLSRNQPAKKQVPMNSSIFQSVTRDFAFVVDTVTPAANIVNAAYKADKKFVVHVEVFDVFKGGALGEGKKSVALQVTMQPREQTFTDKEIDKISEKIISSVNTLVGAVLRS